MHQATIQDIMRLPIFPRRLGLAWLSCLMAGAALAESVPAGLPPMLDRAGTGTDPTKIDYNLLPELSGTCHGPRIEDHPTQHVRYATSPDGVKWSEPQEVDRLERGEIVVLAP